MSLQVTAIGALAAAAAVALAPGHGSGAQAVPAADGRADGAERIPVSGLAGSLQNPCFSPDSARIALTLWPRRYNEGVASVHVADLATGKVSARLTPAGASGVNLPGTCWNRAADRIVFSRTVSETDIAWAPDGKRIVFSSDEHESQVASLVAMRASGGKRTRITRSPGWYDGAPSWSPDGRTIAFEARRGEPDGSPGTRLYRIAAP